MATSTLSNCKKFDYENWQPRPALREAMRRIATIAEGDETAVISDHAITFQNRSERTTISVMPINLDTVDGFRIAECITIRTPLTVFKLFDEDLFAATNIFATTGAMLRETDGQDVIVSKLALFEQDIEALEDLYTPLIANAALLHLIGPLSAAAHLDDRKDEFGPAQVALPGWNQSSYWDASEFAYAEERLRERGIYANTGPAGLTAEFAWEQGAISAGLGDATSLLQIRADYPHPAAGNGLFFRLDLPLSFTEEEANRCANQLNRCEVEGVDTPPFFGAWCRNVGLKTVSFVGFWPNMMYQRGTVANVAFWCAARSRFARQAIGNAT